MVTKNFLKKYFVLILSRIVIAIVVLVVDLSVPCDFKINVLLF